MEINTLTNIYKFAWAQIDDSLHIVRTTENFGALLGVPEEKVLHNKLTDTIDEFVGADSALYEVLHGELPVFYIENVNRHQSHEHPRYLRFSVTCFNKQIPEQGLLLGIEDVTQSGQTEQRLTQERNELRLLQRELFRMNSQLQYIAATDVLTGLANRRHFDEEIDRELARGQRFGRNTALLFLDIDNFKTYNDRYGHLVGDEILRQLGSVLRQYTRKIDTPCRFGGEEFAIILPETSEDGAVAIAERLREIIAKGKLWVKDNNLYADPITVSIGISIAPNQADTPLELIRAADIALYDAKHNGKNQVRLYTQEIETRMR